MLESRIRICFGGFERDGRCESIGIGLRRYGGRTRIWEDAVLGWLRISFRDLNDTDH